MLFVAELDGQIVGSLTLATYRIPTGLKAIIEDVVVESEARGLGIGESLSAAAIEEAQAWRQGRDVEQPARTGGGDQLYLRIGWPAPERLPHQVLTCRCWSAGPGHRGAARSRARRSRRQHAGGGARLSSMAASVNVARRAAAGPRRLVAGGWPCRRHRFRQRPSRSSAAWRTCQFLSASARCSAASTGRVARRRTGRGRARPAGAPRACRPRRRQWRRRRARRRSLRGRRPQPLGQGRPPPMSSSSISRVRVASSIWRCCSPHAHAAISTTRPSRSASASSSATSGCWAASSAALRRTVGSSSRSASSRSLRVSPPSRSSAPKRSCSHGRIGARSPGDHRGTVARARRWRLPSRRRRRRCAASRSRRHCLSMFVSTVTMNASPKAVRVATTPTITTRPDPATRDHNRRSRPGEQYACVGAAVGDR